MKSSWEKLSLENEFKSEIEWTVISNILKKTDLESNSWKWNYYHRTIILSVQKIAWEWKVTFKSNLKKKLILVICNN